jgi:hypothetical protein
MFHWLILGLMSRCLTVGVAETIHTSWRSAGPGTPQLEVNITDNLGSALWALWKRKKNDEKYLRIGVDAICTYFDRYRTEYRGNLRLGPLFSEGFRFALVGSIYRFLFIPPSSHLACSLSRSQINWARPFFEGSILVAGHEQQPLLPEPRAGLSRA